MNHGTTTGYNYHKCRCALCTEAVRAYKERQKERRSKITLREDDPRHGTKSFYVNHSCRCALCTQSMRDYDSLRKYGVTQTELLEKQGGKCASCKVSTPKSKKGWHIDHNHKNGKVRGLLCFGCNVALGMLEEDTARVKALLDYIIRFDV